MAVLTYPLRGKINIKSLWKRGTGSSKEKNLSSERFFPSKSMSSPHVSLSSALLDISSVEDTEAGAGKYGDKAAGIEREAIEPLRELPY